MATLKKRGDKWYGCWRENGKQMWRTLSSDRGAAQVKLSEIVQNLASKKNGALPKDIRWADFVEKYMAFTKANKAPNTIIRDAVVFRNFDKSVHIENLSDLVPEVLEDFKSIRKDAGKMPATINREICILKTAMKKAGEWGYVSVNIWGVSQIPEVKKRPVFYIEEEIKTLLSKADPFWRVIIHLGYFAGLRKGEMLALDWHDIDFEKHQIKVTPKDDWTPKDYEAREIEMHPELETCLKSWKQTFSTNGHTRIIPWTGQSSRLSAAFTRFRKKAEISKGSLHSLRHSFASHMAMAGIDLYRIGKMMGHSSVVTTAIYAHLLPSSLREAIMKLPGMNGDSATPI